MVPVYNLEAAIGRRLDVVHIYKSWGNSWGQFNAQTKAELESAGSDGRRVLLTWEPWLEGQGVYQSDFSLAAIVAGLHEDYIRSWAAGLRSFGHVIYLRPMHEMNGDWYPPWGGTVNGNTPAEYAAAWRHIHHLFEDAGADNVRWVWCPYALDVPSTNEFESYYPGEEYVDVLALDAYNWGVGGGEPDAQYPARWQNVDDLLRRPYQRLAGLGHQPVWLAEIGCAEQGGDKAEWLRSLLESRRYSRVSAIILFDADKERDWRVTSSTESARAFSEAIVGATPAPESQVVPAPPGDIEVVTKPSGIYLAWSNDAGIIPALYQLEASGLDGVVWKGIVGGRDEYLVQNLKPGLPYTFIVRTISSFGVSGPSRRTSPVVPS
jgi:hypothetical protein